MKFCSTCGLSKPATSEYFHRDKKSSDGFCHRCKVCVSLYQRQHYSENRGEIRLRHDAYYHENKKRIQKYKQEWRIINREQIAQREQEYQKENPEKFRVNSSQYRARKRKLPSMFTKQQWELCLTYFNGCCAVCGRQLKDLFGTHTVAADHWIPVSYEGDDNPGTVATNIIPLCHGEDGCNNSKKNKLPAVWLTERYGTRKANEILQRIETYFAWVLSQNEGAA